MTSFAGSYAVLHHHAADRDRLREWIDGAAMLCSNCDEPSDDLNEYGECPGCAEWSRELAAEQRAE